MNGIINVYKEAGYTSHDVVARLRGILKIKRIGHTGTLDPAARGVLPVCIGRSTVLADIISEGEKEYEAVLLLGTRTDTYDLEGNILEEREVACSEEEAAERIAGFIGEQEQLPPMYSAVKIGGKKLYELARKGIEVERKPRRINISRIEIKEMSLPRITMSITCSKGTYIRTLCHDIGEALGCGGCMAELLRTKVGIFNIEDAYRIDEIKDAAEAGDLSGILTGPDEFFPGCAAVKVCERAEKAAYNGNMIRFEDLIWEDKPEGTVCPYPEEKSEEMVRLYDTKDRFIGLFTCGSDAAVRPYKMLYDI